MGDKKRQSGILDEWQKTQIETARSVERLDFLRWIIQDDTKTCQQYTKNEPFIDELRELWIHRKREIEALPNRKRRRRKR